METIGDIAFYILVTYCIIQGCCLLSLLLTDDETHSQIPVADLPFVSILIAARNEEENIINCLRSINHMDYPKEKLQVLIGNDQSEDETPNLIANYIADKSHMTLVNITEKLGKARGKANVLAQLAHMAKGSYFLITDADIQVNPKWAKELVTHFDSPKMGIVSGTTIVRDKGYMGRMQEIDWMYFMGLLKSFANIKLHCTAVGNNMAIKKEAYFSTGGYEHLDFSITEDYKMYNAVRKKGWKTKNILNPRSLNRSSAIASFITLMHQRKRWLTGAKELPFYWWLLFGVFGLFMPAIVLLAMVNLKLAVIFYGIKLSLQTATVVVLQQQLKIKKNIDYLFGYEIYSLGISLCTQLFYVWPSKLVWKNRSYQ